MDKQIFSQYFYEELNHKFLLNLLKLKVWPNLSNITKIAAVKCIIVMQSSFRIRNMFAILSIFGPYKHLISNKINTKGN